MSKKRTKQSRFLHIWVNQVELGRKFNFSPIAMGQKLVALGLKNHDGTPTEKALWSVGNQYIDATAPWKLIKVDREAAAQAVRTCLHLIRIYALVSAPIIPFTSEKLFDALQLSETDRMTKMSESVNFEALPLGHAIHAIAPLFRKLEEEEIQELSAKFGMRE